MAIGCGGGTICLADWTNDTGREEDGAIGEFELENEFDGCGDVAASVKVCDVEEVEDDDGVRSMGETIELLRFREFPGKPEELLLGDKRGDRVGKAIFGILDDAL